MPFKIGLTGCGDKVGIIIFKHLEIKMVDAMPARLLQDLKEKFDIGVYFGIYTRLKKDVDWADFYMAAPGVLEFSQNSNKPRLMFNGFHFISEGMYAAKRAENPPHDFIYVGTPSRRKGLKIFLDALRQITNESGSAASAIIINRVSRDIYTRLLNTLVRRKVFALTKISRLSLSYIELDDKKNQRLSHQAVSALMRESKALVLPSIEEGGARVVAEAKILGLSAITYKKMRGATNNHAGTFDVMFNEMSDLANVLESFLRDYATVYRKSSQEVAKYTLIFGESKNRQQFAIELSNILGHDVAAVIDGISGISLYNSISSHGTHLPRGVVSRFNSDEIYSRRKMYRFFYYCLRVDRSPPPQAYVLDLASTVSTPIKMVVNKVSRIRQADVRGS